VDVSNPAAPRQIAFLPVPDVQHRGLAGSYSVGPEAMNVTFVTDTIIYVSPGGGHSRLIRNVKDPTPTWIVDVSDPANPEIVATFAPKGGSGCNDIRLLGHRSVRTKSRRRSGISPTRWIRFMSAPSPIR
jgi:hypothetical protein